MNERRAVIVAAAVAVLMVVGLVAFRALNSKEAPTTPAQFEGADEIAELFRGVPQSGTQLGDPSAPVRIVEYVDYKCPHCADAALDVIPTLVTDHVRPGKVRMQLKPLAFLAPDSREGAWAGAAAARQNAMWQFSELVLRNQGDEGTPWLTRSYIVHAAEVTGIDPTRLLADMERPAVRARLTANQRDAELDEARSTPFWVVTGPQGTRSVAGNNLGEIVAAIEAVS